jgi:hypothetical protein
MTTQGRGEIEALVREYGSREAPWYLADGSTVMLPVEEVERRRKAAAKVIWAARCLISEFGGPQFRGALRDALDALGPEPAASPADAKEGKP